jgi:hypothetical protein
MVCVRGERQVFEKPHGFLHPRQCNRYVCLCSRKGFLRGAQIAHFGGGFEDGVVVRVREEARRLEVRDEAGEVLEFVLNPATARFVAAGSCSGRASGAGGEGG